MPIFPCPTSWPAAEEEASLIPLYLRPTHACALEADHVRHEDQPHRCHCGAEQLVRDAGQRR